MPGIWLADYYCYGDRVTKVYARLGMWAKLVHL